MDSRGWTRAAAVKTICFARITVSDSYREMRESPMREGRARWSIESSISDAVKRQDRSFSLNLGHCDRNMTQVLACPVMPAHLFCQALKEPLSFIRVAQRSAQHPFRASGTHARSQH